MSIDVKQIAQERYEKRQRCKTDLLYLANVLGYDFQADVHSDLFACYLKKDTSKSLFDLDTVKNRLVLWSRGHFKTSSIVVEIVQLILNYPDIRILLMQGTVKNTMGLLAEIKSHFTGQRNNEFSELFPEFCSDKLGTKTQFTVPARARLHLKESTVTVASPKSVKAGLHFDAGFFDDVVNDQNYRNPLLMEQAIKDFSLYEPLIDPGGYRYVTGTRYAFGDLYEWIQRNNKGEWFISLRECWSVKEGKRTLTFPERRLASGRVIGFTFELLERIQRDDPEMFAAQYLNRPISTKAQLFTKEMLLARVVPTRELSLSKATLFIDLASSRRDESDHSVVIAGKVDHLGKMYVVDVRGERYSPDRLALVVMEMALIHRPHAILIENTSAAKYFVELLRVLSTARNLSLPLDFIKIDNTKDAKYLRIASLESAFTSNRLYFALEMMAIHGEHWERIVTEFTSFPKGRHDDYPDTISLMSQHYMRNIPAVRPMRIEDHPFFAEPEYVPDMSARQMSNDYSCGSDFADS